MIRILHLLIKFIRYSPVSYVTYCIAFSLVYLLPILPGLLTKEFFDILNGHGAYHLSINMLIALLLVFALARMVAIIFGLWLEIRFRFRVSGLLRRNMLKHILKKPGANALPCSSGKAITHFREDVEQIEDAVALSVDAFGMTFFSIVSFIILININKQITIWVFLPLVIVVSIAQFATTKLQKYREASRESTSRVTEAISEMFNHVQAIQVSASEDRFIEKFDKLNDARRKSIIKDVLSRQIVDSLFSNTVNIGTGFILLLAANSMRSGNFTVGDFVLFVYYLSFVSEFIVLFGNFLASLKQSTVSLERILNLLGEANLKKLTAKKPLFLRGELPEQPVIEKNEKDKLVSLEVRNLSYQYTNTGQGIHNINLSIKKNSVTIITGRIGSGKTTLLRVLLGLLPMEQGEIKWNGEPVSDPGTFFIPPRVAYTSQIPRLFSNTLKQNILLGMEGNENQLQKAIHSAVMEYDLERFDEGLDTTIGSRGVKLSGGQIKRAAASRMFVRNTELIVFDDVTSGLDMETERIFWERIFSQKKTCIAVSHSKTAFSHADHIIVLKDGCIEDEGKLEHLLESSEVMRRLWYVEEGAVDTEAG